jgi:hypothetical protein
MTPDDLHRLAAGAARLGPGGILLAVLAACTSLGPFEGPQPNADEHALCYTKAATTPDQLHATASAACGGGDSHVVKQETDLSACPLLQPMRLFFTCGAG